MPSDQQREVRTTTLYPEAVIPQASARQIPWGPVLVALLVVATAGVALAWSFGLAGLRQDEPIGTEIAATAPVLATRSPYPSAMPDLASHPVIPVAPPAVTVVEPAPIAEPPPVKVAPPPSLPVTVAVPRAARARIPLPDPVVVAVAPRFPPPPKALPHVIAATPRTAMVRALVPPRAAQPLNGPLARLFGPSDYPPAARRNGEQGDVTVRLAIGGSGRVSACRLLAADASALLKSATCAILIQRARFAPATDSSGAATDGSFIQHVAWRLP